LASPASWDLGEFLENNNSPRRLGHNAKKFIGGLFGVKKLLAMACSCVYNVFQLGNNEFSCFLVFFRLLTVCG